jgi:hypothetical protein
VPDIPIAERLLNGKGEENRMNYYMHHVPGRLRIKIPHIKGKPSKDTEIRQLLSKLDGLEKVSVNIVTGSVVFYYDSDQLQPWQILSALEELRYIDPTNQIPHHSPAYSIGTTGSKAGDALGRVFFGWAVGKALERTGLSFLTALI